MSDSNVGDEPVPWLSPRELSILEVPFFIAPAPTGGNWVVRESVRGPLACWAKRDESGSVLVSAICPHRGFPLRVDNDHPDVLVCDYHGMRVPAPTTDDPSIPLKEIAGSVRRTGPLVLGLPAEDSVVPGGVLDQLTSELERCWTGVAQAAARIDYEVSAGWDLIVENFLECVHCPFVHKDTIALDIDLAQYEASLYRDGAVFEVKSVDVEQLGSATRTEPTRRRQIFWVYPFTAVSVFEELIVTFFVTPITTSRSRVTREIIITEDSVAPQVIKSLERYYTKIADEDAIVVETLERLRSRLGDPVHGSPLVGEEAVLWFRELLSQTYSKR